MKTQEKLIYIVEDSKIIADILAKVISSVPNTKTKDFCNGESMLNELNYEMPDMIFLDYYLYENGRKINNNSTTMNGEQVFNEIMKVNPDVPVVLLTGLDDYNVIEKMKTNGICCVIHKEVDDIYNSVLDCVQKYLPQAV